MNDAQAPIDRPAGARVLVVEDDYLVALLIEDMLVDLGHRIIGPASEATSALAMAQSEAIDVAILDVNLRGADTYPIAAALAARAIPFIFATGYGRQNLREPYGDAPLLKKPFQQSDLEDLLAKVLGAGNLGRAGRSAGA